MQKYISVISLITLLFVSACGSKLNKSAEKKIATSGSKNSPNNIFKPQLQLKTNGSEIQEKAYALLKKIYGISFSYFLEKNKSISSLPCIYLASLRQYEELSEYNLSELQDCLQLSKQLKLFFENPITRNITLQRIKNLYPFFSSTLKKIRSSKQSRELIELGLQYDAIGKIILSTNPITSLDITAATIESEFKKISIATSEFLFDANHSIAKNSSLKEYFLPNIFATLANTNYPLPDALPSKNITEIAADNSISMNVQFDYLFEALQKKTIADSNLEKVYSAAIIPSNELLFSLENNFSQLQSRNIIYSNIEPTLRNIEYIGKLSSLFPSIYFSQLSEILQNYSYLYQSLSLLTNKKIDSQLFIYNFYSANKKIYRLLDSIKTNSAFDSSFFQKYLEKFYESLHDQKDIFSENSKSTITADFLKILSQQPQKIKESFSKNSTSWDFLNKLKYFFEVDYANILSFPDSKKIAESDEKFSIFQSKEFLLQKIGAYETSLQKIESKQNNWIQEFESRKTNGANITSNYTDWHVNGVPVKIWDYAAQLKISTNEMNQYPYFFNIDKQGPCIPVQTENTICVCMLTKEHRVYLELPGTPRKLLGYLYYADYSVNQTMLAAPGLSSNDWIQYKQQQFSSMYSYMRSFAVFTERETDINKLEIQLEAAIHSYLQPIQNQLQEVIIKNFQQNENIQLVNELEENYQKLIALISLVYRNEIFTNPVFREFIFDRNSLKNKESFLRENIVGAIQSSKENIQKLKNILLSSSANILPEVYLPFLWKKIAYDIFNWTES